MSDTAVNNLIRISERMGIRPRPLASRVVYRISSPPMTVLQAWESFVKDAEHVGWIGPTDCAWCEGERGADGLLEHALDCPFEAMDRAVMRARGTR